MALAMSAALEYDDNDVIDEALSVGLWDAMSREHDSFIVLVAAGADPSIISGKYGTTLNAACTSGDINVVEKSLALLSKDDMMNAAASELDTPFQWVMRGKFRYSRGEDIIAVLELLKAREMQLLEAKVGDEPPVYITA